LPITGLVLHANDELKVDQKLAMVGATDGDGDHRRRARLKLNLENGRARA
jgi:hypothetical protein